MRKLAIIADDLSSATDCGIQVARSGLQTFVPLSWEGIRSAHEGVEVVSIDTGTRCLPAGEAYDRVKTVTGILVTAGYPTISKSIDSTLRGNLGAEIDAVLDVFDTDLAVVAPAYPLYGRTTVGGKHYLNGELIHRTEFSTDPQCPVQEADLIELLSSQSRRKVGLVPLDTLRSGQARVQERLASLIEQGAELAVFDAEVEPDLDRLAGAVAASGHRILWAGSTGMARCIPHALGIEPRDGSRPAHPSRTDQILVVVGSASNVTHRQLDHLKRQMVMAVEMDLFRVIDGGDAATAEIERCCVRLADALHGGYDVALHITSSRIDVSRAQALGARRGLTPVQVSAHIVSALARITRWVVDGGDLRGLVLTGGDTAKAVCCQLGALGITILEEVEPGIPLGRLVGERGELVVTKAGAFGTPQALMKSVDALKKSAQCAKS